uniref:Uncharacterized protein n=1 Tax=Meloidogyne floridensis TaxID=298350 RepID=A0A915P1W1_9BILA
MDDEDMTDELTQQQTTKKPCSTLSNQNKKRNRIDQFAAILASRTKSTDTTSQKLQPFPNKLTEQGTSGNSLKCSICKLSIQNDKIKEARKCSSCMKFVHFSCDNEMEAFGTYRCVPCRKGPLVGGDEMLSCTMLPDACMSIDQGSDEDDYSSLYFQNDQNI